MSKERNESTADEERVVVTETGNAEAAEVEEATTAQNSVYGAELVDTLFPYVDNKEHWDIDFNDTKQSYEGSALPAWVLAGFAIYIIWAAVYLIVALSA